MNVANILQLRLSHTGLSTSPFKNAAEAVEYLGAVQSQDFAAAKWALALRVKNATDETVETAFNSGEILRTHVLRPTWHFVLPNDIRWMLKLTAPRVKILMGHYNRKLELDEKLFKKSSGIITKALENHTYLTRQELKQIFERNNITTDVQRLAHVIMWAELDGLICSGPRRGKQFTYALLEERAPQAKEFSREEALAKMAMTYFTSHGPAQLKDFSWWSGLSVADAKQALQSTESKLQKETVGDKIYWFSPSSKPPAPIPRALALSIYDEYVIAYKDRSALSEKDDFNRLLAMGNALTAVLIIDGKVAGTWKRILKKNMAEIIGRPFRKLTKNEIDAVEAEGARYEKFMQIQAKIILLQADS